jgi:hypothetical protein
MGNPAAGNFDRQLRHCASARRNELMPNFAKPIHDADRAAMIACFTSHTASCERQASRDRHVTRPSPSIGPRGAEAFVA